MERHIKLSMYDCDCYHQCRQLLNPRLAIFVIALIVFGVIGTVYGKIHSSGTTMGLGIASLVVGGTVCLGHIVFWLCYTFYFSDYERVGDEGAI